MKIDGWHIDGYGVHADRSDRGLPGGLTVIHGPNESGKSTLADFLVGMLFGFTPVNRPDHHAALRGGTYGGRLFLTDESGRALTISRGARQSSLRITDEHGEVPAAELAQLLGGATKDLYLSIFAVHVEEVAELRALTDDQVRDRVFSAGILGAGRTAQQALGQLTEQRDVLWKPTGRGDRYQLKALRAQLVDARAALGAARQQALDLPELLRRLEAADAEAQRLADDAEGLRAERRHLGALIDVWEHWAGAEAARRTLAELGDVAPVPADLARRIHAAEELLVERTAVAEQARASRDAAQASRNSLSPVGTIVAHAAAVTALAAEAPVEDERADHIAELEQQVATAAAELEADLRRLGPDCDRAWLATQPRHLEADAQLRQTAAAVTTARHHLDDAVNALASATADAESESAALATEQADLDRRPKIDPARARAGRDQAIRLLTLVDQHDAARRRLEEARHRHASAPPSSGVPSWTARALGALAALALIGAVIAIATGAPIAGGLSALVAAVAAGLANALRGTLTMPAATTTTDDTVRHLAADELARVEDELDPVLSALGLDAIPTAAHAAALAAKADAVATRTVETALARQQLDQRTRTAHERTARLLRARRTELELAESALARATLAWCTWLEQRQLPATLDPEAAAEHLALVARAHDRATALDHAQAQLTRHRQASTDFGERVLALAAELPEHLSASDPRPVAVARHLAAELATHERRQHALDQAERALTQAQLATRGATQRLQEAAAELAATLAEISVDTVQAAHARLETDRTASELRARIDRAELALTTAFGTDPDRLAAARQRLTSDDPTAWQGDLERIEAKLSRVHAERDGALHQRSLLSQQIDALERSTDVPRCELAVADLQSQLLDGVRQWAALTVALQLVEGTLARYQRERQPAVIQRAAELFSQITDGRYPRLEVRDRDIVAVDRAEREVPAGGLSRGTVEQLYLCMRFALAESFSTTAPLPLLLDDVTVNADGERHPRLAQVIANVAQRHQVLVFTGHTSTVSQLQAHSPELRLIELPASQGPAQFNLVAGA